MPKITVLIGIYNCAPTLPEALDSLLAQTCQDFKIVLCDDGSTDDTYSVAKSYADRYDNILLISNGVNRGLNYTLNHCLEYADTEYCARMDGDDISLPTRFEKELAFLETHPEYAIVSTPMIYFDENGDYRAGRAAENPDKNDFVKGTPICHAPCMVRTSALKEVGGYTDDPWLRRVEDYHLWFKMYAAGYKAYNLQEPLYRMRDDRNAYSRRNWITRRNEFYVKYIGFRMLGISWYRWPYILRPLVLYCLPNFIYDFLHRRR
jgi:glycosyltransferase EpsE